MKTCKHGNDPIFCPYMHNGGGLDPHSTMYAPYKTSADGAQARADLERRTVDMFRRILHGELDPRGFESLRAQERREKCEDEIRALLAEWEARK